MFNCMFNFLGFLHLFIILLLVLSIVFELLHLGFLIIVSP